MASKYVSVTFDTLFSLTVNHFLSKHTSLTFRHSSFECFYAEIRHIRLQAPPSVLFLVIFLHNRLLVCSQFLHFDYVTRIYILHCKRLQMLVNCLQNCSHLRILIARVDYNVL